MTAKIGRHLAGALVACLAFVAQGAVIYPALLAFAIATDTDTGGPLAGPFLVLLACAVGVVLIPLLFLPAGVIADAVAERMLTKWLAASAVAGALAVAYVFPAALATGAGTAHSLLAALLGALAVLAPTALCVAVPHAALKLLPSAARS